MFCAHVAAQPDFMPPIWEAEWYIIYIYIYISHIILDLNSKALARIFCLAFPPTTDGFTPELKTNEEQKQACCCVDYFLLTSISLLKTFFKVYIF